MEKSCAVTIVTIKNKILLYKGEEQANAIEVIELEEVGYELVANKSLYQIGDKAVLIQPDYNLSDISLFDSFIRPNGDESKSMLGKVGGQARRIRAKKFNLSKEPNGDPVYSNGILLPWKEVQDYIDDTIPQRTPSIFGNAIDLVKELGITKYEEPENNRWTFNGLGGLKTGASGKFPEGIYKTDEENINNLWNHLENKIGYPITLVGTEKVDGSSITIGITPEIPEGFICSRNLRKKLTIKKVTGRRDKTAWETIKSWFGIKVDLNTYEEVENDDDFVKYGKPYLDLIKQFRGKHNLILRGELNGGKLKGSGNKNNPASKENPNIKFFGMDKSDVNSNAYKLSYEKFRYNSIALGLPMVKEVFNKQFNSKEEILQECNQYFKQNMIEGIVIRTLDSKFSAKCMNLEYDSKK
jgi:hypothetical protein